VCVELNEVESERGKREKKGDALVTLDKDYTLERGACKSDTYKGTRERERKVLEFKRTEEGERLKHFETSHAGKRGNHSLRASGYSYEDASTKGLVSSVIMALRNSDNKRPRTIPFFRKKMVVRFNNKRTQKTAL